MSMVDLCLQATDARASRRRHMKRLMVLAVGLAVAGSATAFGLSGAAAQDSTIVVTTSEDGSPSAPNVECPAANGNECTLRAAVAVAEDGDTITFASGIDPELSDGPGLGSVDIGDARSITIEGNVDGGEPGTTISGGEPDVDDYSDRLFRIEGGAGATFMNVTLTGGSITGSGVRGGAIENLGDLTIIDSLVRDNQAEATSTSGSFGGAIFNGQDGMLTVEGSRFIDNRAPGTFGINDNPWGQGGAIYNEGTVDVSNSEFEDNFASRDGGAISSEVGSATVDIVGSRFLTNQAGIAGGAIHGARGTGITIDGTRVEGNQAQPQDDRFARGGAIYAGSNVQVVLRRSELVNNEARNDGGAVFSTGGTVTFDRATVRDNRARRGGALNGFSGSVFALDASTFSGNVAHNPGSAPSRGGVLWQDAGGALTVTNSTLSGNGADEGGALWLSGSSITSTVTHTTIVGNSGEGILQFGDFIDAVSGSLIPGSSTVTIAHSIIADNSGGDCASTPLGLEGDGASPLASDGHNLDSDGTCALDATDLTGDALLGSLADNGGPTLTHLPQEGSPAIEGGLNPTCVLSEDQRGLPRPGVGTAACDIGAVEVQGQIDDVEDDPVTPVDPGDEPREPGEEPAESVDEAETLPESGPAVPVKSQPDFTG